MDTTSYKTVSANKATVTKEWVMVDAKDQVLGRLASAVAMVLRGKHKPDYTPHVDCGDHVVVINAEKVRLTGKKWTDKVYFSHSGYPGSQKKTSPADLLATGPMGPGALFHSMQCHYRSRGSPVWHPTCSRSSGSPLRTDLGLLPEGQRGSSGRS